ncbi:phosphoadenosine phosphosulfate reductase family protein [Motiliproteus sp.]|uniref:phosphoadenosine phosphosulfate reductase domain-containing protein n=1 Tax=Motiliproteus sp. TaxID=1898955 RepID=UPI003BACACF2
MLDIAKANQELLNASPQQIIEWAIKQAKNPITTTNFGPFEAVILHMAVQVKADIPVVWIDSGYNTRETYKVAQQLIDTLNLNIDVYTPKVSAARCDAALGGIPSVDDERHAEFTEQFKLEPFARAMNEYQPDVWLTAVRSEQTAFRQEMEIVGTGPNGVLKVAPLLHWKEADMQRYLEENDLPNVIKYFDPTKALANRECGLHTKL